jgi:hypothetical protein
MKMAGMPTSKPANKHATLKGVHGMINSDTLKYSAKEQAEVGWQGLQTAANASAAAEATQINRTIPCWSATATA